VYRLTGEYGIYTEFTCVFISRHCEGIKGRKAIFHAGKRTMKETSLGTGISVHFVLS
jgi:hypothetical protein